jgi:hypothetical protein
MHENTLKIITIKNATICVTVRIKNIGSVYREEYKLFFTSISKSVLNKLDGSFRLLYL